MTTTNKQRPVVVGIGELLWDEFPGGAHLGGAPVNFVNHVRAQGADGIVVSAVGDDDRGRRIVDEFARYGLTTDYINVYKGRETGYARVALDSNGIPNFQIVQDAAFDHLQLTPVLIDMARKADVIHYGTLIQRSARSRESLYEYLSYARSDSLRVCDLNVRQATLDRAIIDSSLRFAHLLKINHDELVLLSEMMMIAGSDEKVLYELMDLYDIELIACTYGKKGSMICTRDEVVKHAGYETEVVDTVGAGDAFTASLVIEVLGGSSIATAGDRANRLASFVCSQRSANPLTHR